jgi:hypothetical protein
LQNKASIRAKEFIPADENDVAGQTKVILQNKANPSASSRNKDTSIACDDRFL